MNSLPDEVGGKGSWLQTGSGLNVYYRKESSEYLCVYMYVATVS